jgi:integrase
LGIPWESLLFSLVMRGHLEDRGKNVWRAKVYAGRQTDGRRMYVTRTIHGTKRFAEGKLAELLLEVGHTDEVTTDGTLADLVRQWRPMAEVNLSPTTLHEYDRLLEKRILPRFGQTKVRSIRAADIDAFYADLQRRGRADGGPLGAQSIHHIHALFRRLLNQAVRWGWVANSPVTRASPPRVHRHELTIPKPEVVAKLIEQAEEKDSDLASFLRLAVVTGARRGELCALRWTDIDMKTATVRIARSLVGERNDELAEKSTKTHASRRISLDRATLSGLELQHRQSEERARAAGSKLPAKAYVFSDSPDGSVPWRPNRVTHAFIHLCDEVDVSGVRLHDLRHFAATRLLAAGVPVNTVAGRLGHANAATTLNVYGHFLESSDVSAAQVLGSLLDSPKRSAKTKGSPNRRSRR